MRPQEAIHIGVVSAITLLAIFRPIASQRRLRVIVLAVLAVGAILAARFLLSGSASRVVRDWLPAALLLVPYWQAGQFFTEPDTRLQNRLLAYDARLFARLPVLMESRASFWARYLEFAYLICYPVVPLGFGALWIAHHSSATNFYWTNVVVSSDVCFLCTIFLPALPPRLLTADAAMPSIPSTELRSVNLEVLNRGSIQAITFPSAHVASTMAVAFVLLRVMPASGAIFLVIALSIACGAFLGRYHYAWDVAAGALLAMGAFLATLLFF
jgi:membrane-associated phospholipid phosphatase